MQGDLGSSAAVAGALQSDADNLAVDVDELDVAAISLQLGTDHVDDFHDLLHALQVGEAGRLFFRGFLDRLLDGLTLALQLGLEDFGDLVAAFAATAARPL